jgi:hypothetical protein
MPNQNKMVYVDIVRSFLRSASQFMFMKNEVKIYEDLKIADEEIKSLFQKEVELGQKIVRYSELHCEEVLDSFLT